MTETGQADTRSRHQHIDHGSAVMGAYLDRLNQQYDEVRQGVETLIDRAAEDNRDVTDDEQKQVDRDKARMTELETAIKHYSEIETQAGKVTELRRSVPASSPSTTATKVTEPEYDIAREFPTVADYAITVHRATALREPAAREKLELLERATQHQLTTDNPGLIPRPILGPVINLIQSGRPFISAITNRPLPTGKFDRPVITQHVAIGKQAVEKDLTASQKLLVGVLPVAAATYAGHLNISRQDIKWTSPAILNIVFDDFALMYALATCDDACDQFVASLTNDPVDVEARTAAGVTTAFYTAAAAALTASSLLPDTVFAAPDVWAALGGMTNPAMGTPSFPSLSLTAQNGNPLGLKLVVDQHFPPGFCVIGPAAALEWYEDVDGLMQVGEPDVLGQLVGYAGFGAFLNTAPEAFTPFVIPPAAP